MEKIALFGTSADPPTLGHYAILRYLSEFCDRVAVWTSDNPFKSHNCELKHRIKMLQLMIEELNKKHKNISYYPQLSYLRSLTTVENARQIFGDNITFFLVIGGDLVTEILQWYKSQELLAQVQLLIIPRAGFELNPDDLKKIEYLGGKYILSSFIPPEISSTDYRENRGKEILSPAVKAYINKHQLY